MLREAGAVTAIRGDAAKLRTPAPSSAEPQPSSSARRPQRLAWRTCSWAAGRVLCTPRQTKGFAHLALKHMWVLWMLGFIPVGSPIPWTFSPLMGASETLGPGRIPGGAGLSLAPCSLHSSKGCSLRVPWADKERRLRAVPGTLKKVQGGKLGSAGRHLVPGAGPDPGRFTCSLIRERGGSGAGGEAACRDWLCRQALQEVVGEVLLCLISGLGQCAHSSWQLQPTPGGYCHEGGS